MTRSFSPRAPYRATLLAALGALTLGACGGKAVIDPGAGGSTGSTTTTTSTTASCDAPADCPGGVCLYATGVCAGPCQATPGGSACGPGQVCNDCATGSCPTCLDCVAACVPATNGACDNHDDCAGTEVCVYWQQSCAPTCTPGSTDCGPSLYCDAC
ncbi:MAG: hypothetical protein IT373_24815, partial [Polyangiaceae bacterium]|nr:hypothetical protein [Polyangiaceae bacterium]